MSYRPLPTVTESADELTRLLRQERDPTRKARLHLLLLIHKADVTSQAEAAERLARHRNTISDWLNRYRQGGLEALLARGPHGKKPGQRTLPDSVLEALQQRLSTPHGFAGYDEIQRWLFQEFDLRVPYKSVYNLVRYHLKAKLKTPRPEHPKKASRKRPVLPSASDVTLP